MRTRITRAFVAAAAAGATTITCGLAVAGSAGAATAGAGAPHRFTPSGGPPVYTAPCSAATGFTSNASPLTFGPGGCAGYVGSGRDFRYAQAIIRVPQTNVIPIPDATAPTLYVGLTSGDAVAIAGLITCDNYLAEFGGPTPAPCGPQLSRRQPVDDGLGPWIGFATVNANPGAGLVFQAFGLGSTNPGDGVRFQVYYPAGGAAHFTITIGPTSATPEVHSFQLPSTGTFSAVFNHAVALVDYSATSPYPELTPGPAPGPFDLRITQFQQGAWTTASGDHGTFTGPWTLNPAIVTNNGTAPPGGTVQVEPAFLWNDGLGNGFGDAFGVWWRR